MGTTAPLRQAHYPYNPNLFGYWNGQDIPFMHLYMGAIYSATVHADMAFFRQLFGHHTVAGKTQKPEQLVNSQAFIRLLRVVAAQTRILFFHVFLEFGQRIKSTTGTGQNRLGFPGQS